MNDKSNIDRDVREWLAEKRKSDRIRKAAPDLLAALKRLLEERSPFQGDPDSCECGPDGTGFDESDPSWVCEHIQAHRAIQKAEGRDS